MYARYVRWTSFRVPSIFMWGRECDEHQEFTFHSFLPIWWRLPDLRNDAFNFRCFAYIPTVSCCLFFFNFPFFFIFAPSQSGTALLLCVCGELHSFLFSRHKMIVRHIISLDFFPCSTMYSPRIYRRAIKILTRALLFTGSERREITCKMNEKYPSCVAITICMNVYPLPHTSWRTITWNMDVGCVLCVCCMEYGESGHRDIIIHKSHCKHFNTLHRN